MIDSSDVPQWTNKKDVVYDKEQFTLDDDLTRRHIYKPVGVRTGIESSIAFNFVFSCFKEGATKWSDLEEPYATFYYKMMNLSSHAVGNKKIDIIVPEQERKKKKFAEAMADVTVMNAALDSWYGKCRSGDRIVFDIETLFDTAERNKVVGYRIWLHSKVTKNAVRHIVAMNANTTVLAPFRPASYEPSCAVDVLGAALRNSLYEAKTLAFHYVTQKDKYLNGRNRNKGKTPSPKQQAETALYPLYNFILSETPLKCHSSILRRYFTSDTNRVAGNTPVKFPVFKDSRDVISVHYNIDDEHNASNLIKNLFSKEAAMFYHVRRVNVLQEQRNINTYLRYTERVPTYDADTVNDVMDLVNMEICDSAFGGYYNEQTTYQLRNEQISAEFYHRMPLPHRIGTHLPTRQKDTAVLPDTVPVQSTEPVEPSIKPLQVLDSDDDENEEIEVEESSSSSSSSSVAVTEPPIPEQAYDEEWLLENDPDGTLALRIFDDPLNYGYTETVFKPLGIHQVSYSVTKRRMLECRDYGLSGVNMENPDDDDKRKFMDSRREYVTDLIKRTVLTGGGRKFLDTRLMMVDHMQRGSAQLMANDANDIDSPTNEVYRASTLNYLVSTAGNGMIDPSGKPVQKENIEQEEDTIHLDDDEEEDADQQFRSESGEHGDENSKGPRLCSNRQLEKEKPFLERPNNENYNQEWESYVANALLDVFLPVIEKRRPKGNKMEDLHSSPDIIREEEWMLIRDIELRLAVLNKRAYRSIDRDFFDAKTRKVPDERYRAFKSEKKRFIDATTVEEWHEFFTSEDVSYANEGIRGDWLKATTNILDGKKRINHAHHMRVSRLEVIPYHQYKIWIFELFAVVLDVFHNQKIMYNNYISKFHHCRWHVDSTDPKLNIINHGDNMGGKSFILTNVKKTCPSGVGDMITQITDKAFNVDRNLNDMLIIIEELENKYLGIMPGGKNASSAGGESDALTFFKNRLTSGISAVLHFFKNEEQGDRRDCKQAKSSCQGSYLCATNARLADADRHLLSRFTLQSVPKCFGDKNKKGPKVGHRDLKHQFGTEERQHDIIYEEHKDIHRLVFFTEKCIKANVINNNAYGTSIDSANIMINQILNTMQQDYGIPTDNARKRNSILEFARCCCVSFACWNAVTSPALDHLQYDPMTGEYLGINPRVFTQGVFPFLVITKDMVVDALTSLSGLWQHDHLKNVLSAIVEATNLAKPTIAKYRYITESELEIGQSPANLSASRVAAQTMDAPNTRSRNMVGTVSTQNGMPIYLNAVADYNYVCLVEAKFELIYRNISKLLGELQISANDIEKILRELSEEAIDVPLRAYTLLNASPNAEPDMKHGALVLDVANKTLAKPKIVIIDTCPKTRRPRICLLIAYLKEQLPTLLSDKVVADLIRLQTSTEKEQERVEREAKGIVDDDDDDDDDEEDEEDEMENGKKKTSSDSSEEEDEEDEEASLESKKKNKKKKKKKVSESSSEEMDEMLISSRRSRKRKSKEMSGEMDYHEEEEEEEAVAAAPITNNDTLTRLIERLQQVSSYKESGEAPLIRAILQRYQNSIKDVSVLTPAMEERVRKEYATIFTGYVPWDRHATADHPSPINTSDIFDTTTKKAGKNKASHICKEISFFDTIKSLTLQRKGNKPVILPNYAYVSPSALATLSIFDPLIHDNAIIKSTQFVYNKSSSWILREDIDFTCCKAHLANLGYEPLDTDDVRFRCINFPPFHYQIHADYSRVRLEKHNRAVTLERKERKAKAKAEKDEVKLTAIAKEKADAHIATVMNEYPLNTMLSKVNHQGDIINHLLHGYDTNSVVFHEMLMANSESMKEDFALRDTNVLKCRKRLQYNNQDSQLKAKQKLAEIYQNRLRLTQTTLSHQARIEETLSRHESQYKKANLAKARELQEKQRALYQKKRMSLAS